MDNVWVQVNRHGADVVVETGNVNLVWIRCNETS